MMRILLSGAGLVAAAWAAACGGDASVGPPTSTAPGTHLRYVSGNAQVVDSLNADAPRPLMVRVLDRDDRPLVGATVRWSLRHGNGQLTPKDGGKTDSAGYASALWHLGSKTDTVDASVGNGQVSDSTRVGFHAVMRFDIRLAKISGGNQQVPYGQEMKDPVVIRVTDVSKGGAPVAGVTVHWETFPPDLGSLAVDSITDEQGFARSRWRTGCNYSAPSIWVTIVGQTTNFDLTSVAGPQTRVVPVIAGSLNGVPPLLGAGDTVTATANAFDACSTATATPAAWQAEGNASIESPSAGTQAATALLRVTTPGTVTVSASANGMTGTIQVPVTARLGGIRQVGVGYDFSCALSGAGDVWCWGGSAGPFATVRVSGQQYKQLVVGSFHACALDESGRAFCWSMKDGGGSPEAVQTSARFTKLSAGVLHTCGVTVAGEAMCWGGNLYGEIGDGTTTDRAIPFTIPSSERFTDISAGAWHTCALADGTPFCWGWNEPSALTRHVSRVPLARLASGGECALTADGALYCWTAHDEVARVAGPPFASAAVGHSHACASTSGGDVYCWRQNTFYAAGSLDGESFLSAPKLIADRDVRGQVITGPLSDHSCVLTLEGEVRCWGKVGALGNLRSNLLCVLTRELQLPCRPYGLAVLVKPD